MKTKTCTKCGEEKPATLEYFHAHPGPSIMKAECKVCSNVRARAYRNRPEVKKARAEYQSKVAESDVVEMVFTCRKDGCNRKTKLKYVHKKDVERMNDRFYCEDCLNSAASEAELFDGYYYGDNFKQEEVRASELPLMDSH